MILGNRAYNADSGLQSKHKAQTTLLRMCNLHMKRINSNSNNNAQERRISPPCHRNPSILPNLAYPLTRPPPIAVPNNIPYNIAANTPRMAVPSNSPHNIAGNTPRIAAPNNIPLNIAGNTPRMAVPRHTPHNTAGNTPRMPVPNNSPHNLKLSPKKTSFLPTM